MRPVITPLIILLLTASCNQMQYSDIEIVESDVEYILNTAGRLAEMGPRNAGSDQEKATARFITGELERMSVIPSIEKFTFETYSADSMTIDINGTEYATVLTGINPFESNEDIEGEVIMVPAGQNPESPPAGKIMVSDSPDIFFMALQLGCSSFASLTEEDFEKVKQVEDTRARIHMEGNIINSESANIVADFGSNPAGTGTIYLTAHYDSYLVSPGANDNGTGVGGLLAMARILKSCENSLPYNVRLIFLGAEEVGLVGSRQYVSVHRDDLAGCKAVINFDTFGGNEAPYIATAQGEQGVIRKDGADQPDMVMAGRALEGPHGEWRLFSPSLFPMVLATNYPEWLQAVVDTASANLGMEIYNRHLMSDHLIFAREGVPAISIQSRDHTIHSADDTTANINPESVTSCINLALEIIKEISRE